MAKRIFFAVLKILKIAACVIILLLLILQLYMLIMQKVFKKENAAIFGFRAAVVLTGSMESAVSPGDLIITEKCADYAVGDIVTYMTDGGESITHRIVRTTAEGYITKGDANDSEDADTVKTEAVAGKVVLTVPHIGHAVLFLKTPAGLLSLFAAAVLCAALSAMLPRRRKTEDSE